MNFSPDGRRLATASLDHTVKVWDAASGRELLTLLGLEDQVACAEFNREGTRIAAASGDRKLAVWNAITGQRLLTWRADRLKDYIISVAFSRKRQRKPY